MLNAIEILNNPVVSTLKLLCVESELMRAQQQTIDVESKTPEFCGGGKGAVGIKRKYSVPNTTIAIIRNSQ